MQASWALEAQVFFILAPLGQFESGLPIADPPAVPCFLRTRPCGILRWALWVSKVLFHQRLVP